MLCALGPVRPRPSPQVVYIGRCGLVDSTRFEVSHLGVSQASERPLFALIILKVC